MNPKPTEFAMLKNPPERSDILKANQTIRSQILKLRMMKLELEKDDAESVSKLTKIITKLEQAVYLSDSTEAGRLKSTDFNRAIKRN
jgi:hypothetical protein